MYKINFDKYFNLLNWNIIFMGIKNDIINTNSAIEYANKLAENTNLENDSLLIELFILETITKNEVLTLISGMEHIDMTKEDIFMRILRYIILDNVNQVNQDTKKILDIIDDIHADFDYPQDMNSFIRYMPIENGVHNPAIHTREENEQRLLNNFRIFLKKELEWIKIYIQHV